MRLWGRIIIQDASISASRRLSLLADRSPPSYRSQRNPIDVLLSGEGDDLDSTILDSELEFARKVLKPSRSLAFSCADSALRFPTSALPLSQLPFWFLQHLQRLPELSHSLQLSQAINVVNPDSIGPIEDPANEAWRGSISNMFDSLDATFLHQSSCRELGTFMESERLRAALFLSEESLVACKDAVFSHPLFAELKTRSGFFVSTLFNAPRSYRLWKDQVGRVVFDPMQCLDFLHHPVHERTAEAFHQDLVRSFIGITVRQQVRLSKLPEQQSTDARKWEEMVRSALLPINVPLLRRWSMHQLELSPCGRYSACVLDIDFGTARPPNGTPSVQQFLGVTPGSLRRALADAQIHPDDVPDFLDMELSSGSLSEYYADTYVERVQATAGLDAVRQLPTFSESTPFHPDRSRRGYIEDLNQSPSSYLRRCLCIYDCESQQLVHLRSADPTSIGVESVALQRVDRVHWHRIGMDSVLLVECGDHIDDRAEVTQILAIAMNEIGSIRTLLSTDQLPQSYSLLCQSIQSDSSAEPNAEPTAATSTDALSVRLESSSPSVASSEITASLNDWTLSIDTNNGISVLSAHSASCHLSWLFPSPTMNDLNDFHSPEPLLNRYCWSPMPALYDLCIRSETVTLWNQLRVHLSVTTNDLVVMSNVASVIASMKLNISRPIESSQWQLFHHHLLCQDVAIWKFPITLDSPSLQSMCKLGSESEFSDIKPLFDQQLCDHWSPYLNSMQSSTSSGYTDFHRLAALFTRPTSSQLHYSPCITQYIVLDHPKSPIVTIDRYAGYTRCRSIIGTAVWDLELPFPLSFHQNGKSDPTLRHSKIPYAITLDDPFAATLVSQIDTTHPLSSVPTNQSSPTLASTLFVANCTILKPITHLLNRIAQQSGGPLSAIAHCGPFVVMSVQSPVCPPQLLALCLNQCGDVTRPRFVQLSELLKGSDSPLHIEFNDDLSDAESSITFSPKSSLPHHLILKRQHRSVPLTTGSTLQVLLPMVTLSTAPSVLGFDRSKSMQIVSHHGHGQQSLFDQLVWSPSRLLALSPSTAFAQALLQKSIDRIAFRYLSSKGDSDFGDGLYAAAVGSRSYRMIAAALSSDQLARCHASNPMVLRDSILDDLASGLKSEDIIVMHATSAGSLPLCQCSSSICHLILQICTVWLANRLHSKQMPSPWTSWWLDRPVLRLLSKSSNVNDAIDIIDMLPVHSDARQLLHLCPSRALPGDIPHTFLLSTTGDSVCTLSSHLEWMRLVRSKVRQSTVLLQTADGGHYDAIDDAKLSLIEMRRMLFSAHCAPVRDASSNRRKWWTWF